MQGRAADGNAIVVVWLQVMAYEACRDVMEALRAKYSGPLQVRRAWGMAGQEWPAMAAHVDGCGTPVQVLDHFMTEVGQRFTSRTEERLLAVVYTLQQRTYKTGQPASEAVPEGFKKELAGECVRAGWQGRWIAGSDRAVPTECMHIAQVPLSKQPAQLRSATGVCKACSSRDATVGGKMAHFQQQFAKDLDPASPSTPQTLGEMTERLKVGDWVPAVARMLLARHKRDEGPARRA